MVAFALGTPRLTLTQPITGFAQGVGFGTPRLSLTQKVTGFAQGVGFGTPTILLTTPFTVSPTGYGAGAGFSDPPVATPTGYRQQSAFASPPIITPIGFPRDPYLSYVTFHSHFDAAAPTDVSQYARSISLSSVAVVNVERPKFGAMSLRTNGGTSGAAVVGGSPIGNQFGAGQFTIELWVNWTSWDFASTQTLISAFGTSATFNRGWMLRKDGSNNNLKFYYSTTGADAPSVSGAFTPVVNQWYHIAVDRDSSGFLRIYANGVQVAGASVLSTFWPSTEALRVGNDLSGSTGTQAYTDEVRITKGIARYGGAFTRPTAPFQGWAEGGGGVGFGDVSVAAPAGHAQAVAYGTLAKAVPTGAYSQFAAGNLPTAVPTGAQWGFGVGDGTVAVPFGTSDTVGFGAPSLVLTLPSTPSRGGLRLAQWTFDELVQGWCRLEKLRRELEERQERLEREKRAARRRRGAPSTSITPERRLDKLIADCNQALFDLQEREDELYAGLRSFRADVEAIGAENRAVLARIEADYQKQLLADDEEAILALM